MEYGLESDILAFDLPSDSGSFECWVLMGYFYSNFR